MSSTAETTHFEDRRSVVGWCYRCGTRCINVWCGLCYVDVKCSTCDPDGPKDRVTCWKCLPSMDAVRGREAEQAEAARLHAEEHGLPGLVGSELQIPWAITIRHRVFRQAKWRWGSQTSLPYATLEDTLRWLSERTFAAWWIDRRHWDAREFAKYRYKLQHSPQAKERKARRMARKQARADREVAAMEGASS